MKKLQGIVVSIIGIALAFYLFRQVDREQIFSSLHFFSWKWIAVAFFFYAASVVLRALRWQSMLARHVPLNKMVGVTCIHNFLNHVLPARTGELSYVMLLRQRQNISVSSGTATLIAARLIDLMAMGFFFTASLFFYWHRITVPGFRLLLATLIAIPICVMLILFLLSRPASKFYIRHMPKFRSKWFEKCFQFIQNLSSELHQIRSSGRFRFYLASTFFAWAAKFIAFYCICKILPLGGVVHFGETILGTTFSELASTLPIYGFAGIGTVEGGWTLGFTLLGFETASVIASAFAFHFYIFCFSLTLASASFFAMRRK